MESKLDPLDWGWILDGGSMTPVKTDQVAAPDELVNVIRCNCKLTSKYTCGGKQCSYHNNGLLCDAVCGDCRGMDCENCENVDVKDASAADVEEYGNIFDNIFGN